MTLNTRCAAAIGLVVSCLAPIAGAADAPLGCEALARWDDLPLFRDATCKQFSSYDRSGGNDDTGHYLSEKDGVFVLADVRGPGCIERIWSANPSGTFRLFIDGESKPRVECPFTKLFEDAVPPFLAPLAGRSSGGWYSLVPIPFARGCRIEVAGGERFYYQVTYHQFSPAKEIASFTPTPTPDGLVWLDKARKVASGLGESPYEPDSRIVVDDKSGPLASGEHAVVAELSGPAEICGIRIDVQPRQRDLLRGTAIRMWWDDEKDPSVEAPLGDFFGCGFGDRRFASLPIGMTDEGGYCWFPMPFARSARIEIANESPIAIASLRVEIAHRPLDSPPRSSGRFHARWHRETTAAGQPFVLLEAKGRGHWVGCTMAMQGTSGIHFLEGDEQVFVDGETKPSIVGTGTEDFFSSGWYFATGEFALAFHGLVLKDESVSRIAAYRFQVGDCIPFRKSIRFQIEHGGKNDYPGADYASVAYWYQDEPHDPWSPLPPYEGRHLRSPRIVGAIEGENEEPLGTPLPSIEGDASLPFEASGGRFLRLAPAKGESAGMGFPVNEAGVYEIEVGLVPVEPAATTLTPLIDDRPVGARIALASLATGARTRVSLGSLRLERGRHSLRFASDAPCAFGLDWMQLRPPFREAGAIEAESLKATAAPPGRRADVEIGTLPWSAGGQARLRGNGPGDAILLELPIATAATYDVEACVTRGPEYGRFRASLDGGAAGEPVDAFASAAERGSWIPLVRGASLQPGAHALRLEVDGKAPNAIGYDVGIDCLRLRKSLDAGALEAESLKIRAREGGETTRQDMRGFGDGWSGDAQLFFTPRSPGAFVELEVPVAENGNYQIAVRLTRAVDYGRVQASLDGQPLGKPFDGFDRSVVPSGLVPLGLEYLRKGAHALRFTVVGKSDDSRGFFAGIDSVLLTKKY
jgi:D-arabinan exo alpha-(1,3)/(1,5)-arabinofuranosidase (non-reducing end)